MFKIRGKNSYLALKTDFLLFPVVTYLTYIIGPPVYRLIKVIHM